MTKKTEEKEPAEWKPINIPKFVKATKKIAKIWKSDLGKIEIEEKDWQGYIPISTHKLILKEERERVIKELRILKNSNWVAGSPLWDKKLKQAIRNLMNYNPYIKDRSKYEKFLV